MASDLAYTMASESDWVMLNTGYRWQLVRGSDKVSPSQANAAASTAAESSAASDKGSDAAYEPGPSQHSRPHAGTAGELERLRTALRQKEDQMASLQSQLTNLEATRDRLAFQGQARVLGFRVTAESSI